MAQQKLGIVIANTGSPTAPTPKAVKQYLSEFLMDPRIVPMNKLCWWMILHCFILPKRSVASAEKYQKIWSKDGSPLIIEQDKLAKKLEVKLQQTGFDYCAASAMSYGEPSYESAFSELAQKGCSQVIVLPIYPQPAYSTVGAVTTRLDTLNSQGKLALPYRVVSDYHDNSRYIRAIAQSLLDAGLRVGSDDRVLFSYHSIPMADIESGDNYEPETSSTSLAVAGELGIDRNHWTIGYNCRFDKEREWLSPFTSDVLKRWAHAGNGRVFFVCPNFAIDCLETLYDIEHDLKPAYIENLKAAGRTPWPDGFIRVPCLNSSDDHVEVLFDVLKPYL